jgi:hypothetical protein
MTVPPLTVTEPLGPEISIALPPLTVPPLTMTLALKLPKIPLLPQTVPPLTVIEPPVLTLIAQSFSPRIVPPLIVALRQDIALFVEVIVPLLTVSVS